MKIISRGDRKSSERFFEMFSIPNMQGRVFRLVCSTPNCGTVQDIGNPKNHALPSQVVENKFRQKGWDVGKDKRHDKCPRCVEKETIERRMRRNGVKPIAPALNAPTPPQEPSPPQQEKPMTTEATAMTRDHKRIINIKLHEVYINENEGYRTPWSDKAVAEALGCPVAWVREIREELFGPAADNSEVREFLEKAKTVNANSTAILTDASAKLAEAKAILGAIKSIEATLGDLRRLLDTMNAAAMRIQKAVQP